MKNLEYSNDKVKTEYKGIISNHPAISKIIENLQKEKGKLKVLGIINDIFSNQIVIGTNDEILYLFVDLLGKQIIVFNKEKTYGVIYHDFIKQRMEKIGLIYQNDARSIIKKNILKLESDDIKRKYFEIVDKRSNNKYTMIISHNSLILNDDDFVDYILNRSETVNIRKLFISLSKYLNFNLCDLKLSDANSSTIVIENGILANYIEYQEDNNKYNKIYLENDEFYVEKVIKEKCDDEALKLIKEIGEWNGKEKK